MKFMEWRVAIQTESYDYVGRAGRNITFSDKVNVNNSHLIHFYGK